MASSYIKKKYRFWKRRLKRNKLRIYLAIGSIGVLAMIFTGVKLSDNSINPVVYRPLLQLIADAESSNNYNAYYGNPSNDEVDFTSMTIQEVMDWQRQQIANGIASSAVGRYQIIDSTLISLVSETGVALTDKFSADVQDRLAVALLERRGAASYVKGEISAEQFAANLAMEWAALPRVLGGNPDHSYYAGDGLNHSRVSSTQILAVLASISR